MQDDIFEKMYQILVKIRPEIDFKETPDLVEGGILDSLDIIMLVAAIEETFSVSIDGLQITPENFNSIDNLVTLVVKSGNGN